MTLEELKVKYQALAATCEKRGNEYQNQAQEAVLKGQSENASRYYDMATSEYHKAAMFIYFLTELYHIEIK